MITYRMPSIADANLLGQLGKASFVEAFGHLYSPENLELFLDKVYSAAAVSSDFSNANRLFLVAEEDGRMVGYCKLGLEVSLDYDPGERRTMELKQLYMMQSHVGRGVAQHLMQWALDEARARGFDDVILSVYSDNPRAQRFYQKYGFRHIADTYFMVGNHRDYEYLYALALTA
jgi:diamine N-acetyltransferase